jgi:hypothetical protein
MSNMSLISLITAGLIGLSSEVNAGTIGQRVFETHNGISSTGTIISCWVNDGSSGVQQATVNIHGMWWISAGNFSPPPVAGDTIKAAGSLNYGGVIYTTRMRRIYDDANLTLPTGFLDDPNKNVIALTVGANKVRNRGPRRQYPMNAKGWLQKNPNQKIQFINYLEKAFGGDSLAIDTTDIHPQLYFNLEKQDSVWRQGDTLIAQIYQIKGDTMWSQNFKIPIDTIKYGRASIVDSLRYTADSMTIGVVEENKLENIVEGRLIKGRNILKGENILLNYTIDYCLYDAFGRKVLKGKGNKVNTYGLSSGVYFLKPKDDDKFKPEKVLILK